MVAIGIEHQPICGIQGNFERIPVFRRLEHDVAFRTRAYDQC
jgi:hypothetical protein